MGRNLEKKVEVFSKALEGKRVPVLTLDSKWYRLLDELGRKAVREDENRLNELLRAQGKINSQIKDLKKVKKKLMDEIVPMVDEAELRPELEQQIAKNKELIEQCNQKMDDLKDSLLDYPAEIQRVNHELMLETMAYCYESIQENTAGIEEIEKWVTDIRIELKKRLIRKQEMEQKNHEIYSYMQDIFGAEVLDLFDMTYNPQEKHPKSAEK
ncbi:MAG: hypothetical protein SPI28_01965 [Acetatifactor sp.]|nr:hypothetical protein [Acetatifactor sp.]